MSNRPINMPGPINTEAQVEAIIEANNLDSGTNQTGVEGYIDETYIKAFMTEDYIGERIGMQLVAYCSVNPNKAAPGSGYSEFTYRSGNRRGLKVFLKSDGFITLERSDAVGDDYIGGSSWLPDDGWVVKTYFQIPKDSVSNPPIQFVAHAWTTGTSPNTGLPGYMSFAWMNRAGSVAPSTPTSNNNSILHIEVWKPKP